MNEYKDERREAFEQLEASWNELKRVIIEETKFGKFFQYIADKIGRWL